MLLMMESQTRHTKMGNEQVIAIVFHEIDIITKEQIMLVKYNEDLEDWRLRLMEFVKHSEILEISAGARENLLQNVPDMRLTVSNLTVKDKKVEFKKKCRYDNKGYCKYLENCKYQHFAHLCDQYQKDGKVARSDTQESVNTGNMIHKDVKGTKLANTCIRIIHPLMLKRVERVKKKMLIWNVWKKSLK